MTSKFPTMYCHRLAPKANRMTGSARFSNFPGSISGVGIAWYWQRQRRLRSRRGNWKLVVIVTAKKYPLLFLWRLYVAQRRKRVTEERFTSIAERDPKAKHRQKERERESLSRRFPVNSHHCLGSLPFFPHGDIKIFHVLDSSRRHKSWFQTKNAVNRDEHVERKRAMLVPRRTVRCRLTWLRLSRHTTFRI